MCNPALILGPHLPFAIDAAHPKHCRGQPKAARIVEHILIRGTFRAAVRRVEIERPLLADAIRSNAGVGWQVALVGRSELQVSQVAVDLVGGGEDHRWRYLGATYGFQHIEGAANVDLMVQSRIGEAGSDGHLRRHVKYRAGVAHHLSNQCGVAHVGDYRLNTLSVATLEPREVALDAGS